jgi:hypothetical protein
LLQLFEELFQAVRERVVQDGLVASRQQCVPGLNAFKGRRCVRCLVLGREGRRELHHVCLRQRQGTEHRIRKHLLQNNALSIECEEDPLHLLRVGSVSQKSSR